MKNLLYLCFELPSWIFAGFLIGKASVEYLGFPSWILAVTILVGIVVGFVRLVIILKPKQ